MCMMKYLSVYCLQCSKKEVATHQKQIRTIILPVIKSETMRVHLSHRYSTEVVRLIILTRKDVFVPIISQSKLEDYAIN